MFKWLRADGLQDVEELFTGMLGDGRHVFDLAMSARVAGADPTALAEDLRRTEESTDEAEREIRRRILVHASLHGASDFPACLLYMSIAKDAERVADLSKAVFETAEEVPPPPPGELRDDLVALRDEISPMITEAARIFTDDDTAAAEAFIERARELEGGCYRRITQVMREETDVPQPAATAITYRHLARIVANLLNITSAVVVPLDQLDYPERES